MITTLILIVSTAIINDYNSNATHLKNLITLSFIISIIYCITTPLSTIIIIAIIITTFEHTVSLFHIFWLGFVFWLRLHSVSLYSLPTIAAIDAYGLIMKKKIEIEVFDWSLLVSFEFDPLNVIRENQGLAGERKGVICDGEMKKKQKKISAKSWNWTRVHLVNQEKKVDSLEFVHSSKNGWSECNKAYNITQAY